MTLAYLHTYLKLICGLSLNVLSPVIQKIKQDCSQEFVKFEQCLKENQDTPNSCTAQMSRFLGCAETVDLSGVCKLLQEMT